VRMKCIQGSLGLEKEGQTNAEMEEQREGCRGVGMQG